MRDCPVCGAYDRDELWTMEYRVPDGWPLPKKITWYQCALCGMLFGDGKFSQRLYNSYYLKYYGFGINSEQVSERLTGIADDISSNHARDSRFVDFGGSGDDGKSIACERLKHWGWKNVYNVNAGEEVPECDVLLASHVLEHIYDMPGAMRKIGRALHKSGTLIVDGPDATGIALHWGMPMLDFHTKHLNHFRVIDYLNLMQEWGYELIDSERYIDVRSQQQASCIRMKFKKMSTAQHSMMHVTSELSAKIAKLNTINYPVNVWGLGDIAWHLLSKVNLDVLDYIDNDPAMRGASINGKYILEAPTNKEPIVIIAQGQRSNLLAKIHSMNLENEVILI